MNDVKPEHEGVAIVLAGAFNPRIFIPAWFGKEQLIQEEEWKTADVRIVSSEMVVFSLGWMSLEVLPERFCITSNQPQYFEPLRDFALGTFKLLRHTPIVHLGINKLEHYRSADTDKWHRLGHRLAPDQEWKDLKRAGMRKLSMEGERPDEFKGRIVVTVEPSLKVQPGVFFEVNDHYENDQQDQLLSSQRMMEILEKCWVDSLQRATQITRHQMVTP